MEGGIVDGFQLGHDRAGYPGGGETLTRVAAVHRQVLAHQRLHECGAVRGEGPPSQENLSQRSALVEDPGLHGGEQGLPTDEVHLEGENPE